MKSQTMFLNFMNLRARFQALATHVFLRSKWLMPWVALCGALAYGLARANSASLLPVRFSSADGTVLLAWLQRTPVSEARGTVIALHGCGGLYGRQGPPVGAEAPKLNARHSAMGDLLLADGYHVLWVDSLTPRGERELCTQKLAERKIDQRERRADALAALDWVSTQPWNAGLGVALLGWSHGGSAALAATDGRHPSIVARPASAAKFKVALAFYPGCSAPLQSGAVPNTQIELFLGGSDDWTPPGPCMEWAQKNGLRANVYEGAFHDFDNPAGRRRVRADVPNGMRVGGGATIGPDPKAREAAYERVRVVLGELLLKR